MQEVILLKLGELVLKGLNRYKFEDKLISDIRRRIKDCGQCTIDSRQSTMYIEPADESFDMAEAFSRCEKIFGIVTLNRAAVCEKDMDTVYETVKTYLSAELSSAKTFKVEAKRSDKRYPLTSIEIMQTIGGRIDDEFSNLSVDVHNPELTVYIEIRERGAYIHAVPVPGAGGLPAGVNGKGMGMISGGIDSPVALWLMGRRGLQIEAVHFESYPYTSEEALEKVKTLTELVSRYTGRIVLHVVSFTEIQEEIRDNCPAEYFTILTRRFMVRCAQALALERNCGCMITGESLGQVASQTLESLTATEAVSGMPIFRPLIGLDKKDIIEFARKIGTFDTSILPYEDCCTVFTPKHPKVHPVLSEIEKAEQKLNVSELVEAAVRGAKEVRIG